MPRELTNREWYAERAARWLCKGRHPALADGLLHASDVSGGCPTCRADIVRLVDGGTVLPNVRDLGDIELNDGQDDVAVRADAGPLPVVTADKHGVPTVDVKGWTTHDSKVRLFYHGGSLDMLEVVLPESSYREPKGGPERRSTVHLADLRNALEALKAQQDGAK